MKSKLFLLALVMMALSIAAPVYAATCPFATTLDQLIAAGNCNLGNVTFSNFTVTGSLGTGTTTTSVSFSTGGTTGAAGFTFSPQGGAITTYTISYLATCNASCLITGGADSSSENPAGGSTYNYTLGGVNSGNITGNFNPSFAGVLSATNSGTFVSGGTNQSMTLDVSFGPAAGGGTAPEPTSLILFGSGFLAVGLAARARRKARA